MCLYAQETYVDLTKGGCYGESDVYETMYDNPGDLYRACQRDYGRCTSRVYIDEANGQARPIGWVFVKRATYEDARKPTDTYLQETWVTVHKSPPTKTIEYHYL